MTQALEQLTALIEQMTPEERDDMDKRLRASEELDEHTQRQREQNDAQMEQLKARLDQLEQGERLQLH